MLKNYFKTAWRNLKKNKVYSFINIFGLAVGLACTLLIGLWVKDEISFNRFHANEPGLYRVMANLHWGSISTTGTVPVLLEDALKKEIPEVKYAATLNDDNILLSVGNHAYKEKGYYASPDFLSMFSFPLIEGSPSGQLTSSSEIVISQRLAEKYFPGENAIGKTIKVNNADLYKVSGVVANAPSNSSLQFDWLIPFKNYEAKNKWMDTWGNFVVNMYVMLAPQASAEKLNIKLQHFLKSKSNQTADELFLQPLSKMYLYDHFKDGRQDGGRIEYVKLFSIIALFVLLIACINFMNLTTARSAKRAREVGIRKVIGSQRSALILQFLGEALMLTLFAVLLALGLVKLLLPAFNEITGKTISLHFNDPAFMGGLAAVTLITGIVAGSYPAIFLSSLKPVAIFKSVIVRSRGTDLLRKGLVVFQFTLSIMLIVGTLVVFNQMQYIKNKNLGFDKGNLILLGMDGDLYKNREALIEDLSQLPGVLGATTAMDNPINIDGKSADLSWPEKKPGQVISVSASMVGYDYIKTMNIHLVAGRDFSKTMADSNHYLINESAAKLMNLKDPIGKRVGFWMGEGEIIGVMKDFHLQSLHSAITPLILALQPGNASIMMIRTDKGKTKEVIGKLEQLYKKYKPAYPFDYHFMNEMYEQQYKSETIISKLVNSFAAMAILISCLGLFGLSAYSAEQRTREIGIRKVFGATLSDITGLFSREFLKLVLLATAMALPVAWFGMDQWLQNYAYRAPISWWIFALTAVAAVIIALVTVSFQAIKAALANPVKSLKEM
jgi:putative ABC transport system permease protein